MLIALALAAASPAATFTPSNKWVLDYQRDLCLLTRPFSSGTTQVTFGLRQAPADYQVEVIVLFADDPDDQLRHGIVALKLPGSGKATLTGAAVSVRVPDTRQRLLRFLVSRDDIVTLGNEQSVTIEETGRPAITLKLDGAAKALGALATCETEQIRSWGVDPAQVATFAKPIGNAVQWFNFPLQAANERRDGETTVRWMIGVDGRVHDCTLVRSSGNSVLDAAACAQVLRRGRYQPAIGKDGKPMTWVETRRIIWALS